MPRVTETFSTYREQAGTNKQVIASFEATGWKVISVDGQGPIVQTTLTHPDMPGAFRTVTSDFREEP